MLYSPDNQKLSNLILKMPNSLFQEVVLSKQTNKAYLKSKITDNTITPPCCGDYLQVWHENGLRYSQFSSVCSLHGQNSQICPCKKDIWFKFVK